MLALRKTEKKITKKKNEQKKKRSCVYGLDDIRKSRCQYISEFSEIVIRKEFTSYTRYTYLMK